MIPGHDEKEVAIVKVSVVCFLAVLFVEKLTQYLSFQRVLTLQSNSVIFTFSVYMNLSFKQVHLPKVLSPQC